LSQAQSDFASLQHFFPADNKALCSHLFERAEQQSAGYAVSQLAQDLNRQRHGRPIGLRHCPAEFAAGWPASGRGHGRTIIITRAMAIRPIIRPQTRSPRSLANWDRILQSATCPPPTGILPPAGLPAIRAQQFFDYIRCANWCLGAKLQRLRLTHQFIFI